jgi:hypothetical protein
MLLCKFLEIAAMQVFWEELLPRLWGELLAECVLRHQHVSCCPVACELKVCCQVSCCSAALEG